MNLSLCCRYTEPTFLLFCPLSFQRPNTYESPEPSSFVIKKNHITLRTPSSDSDSESSFKNDKLIYSKLEVKTSIDFSN